VDGEERDLSGPFVTLEPVPQSQRIQGCRSKRRNNHRWQQSVRVWACPLFVTNVDNARTVLRALDRRVAERRNRKSQAERPER
jgi:hypothetical protein